MWERGARRRERGQKDRAGAEQQGGAGGAAARRPPTRETEGRGRGAGLWREGKRCGGGERWTPYAVASSSALGALLSGCSLISSGITRTSGAMEASGFGTQIHRQSQRRSSRRAASRQGARPTRQPGVRAINPHAHDYFDVSGSDHLCPGVRRPRSLAAGTGRS